ncbi:MAG: limonene-1,2-epoxide hydrolase family protein [Henriciella sp.]|nr:limonene-1,2-epoxide hydrolase family protein [Henriciella sp.]
MTPQDTVHAFLNAAAVKDFDTALKFIAPNCEYHNMMMDKVTGPDAVKAALEPFFGPTLENDLKILREVTDGATVVTERLDRHLMEHGWVELPVTGVWEVHDGQITLWHEYFDLQTIMSQMSPAD